MPAVLHVALQDGFDDDTVVVRVNDEEVFRQEGLSTDYRISLAEDFEVPRAEGPLRLEVELPDRDLAGALDIDAEGTVYVAVSVEEGALTFRLSDAPFGYM